MGQQGQSTQLSARDRDVLIRTIIGEAANEGARGWAAVAHVVRNRQRDPRWPSSPAGVALQPMQFSAWNDQSQGGNHLVRSYGPDTEIYQQVGQVVDRVYGGQVADETGGAVYYYAPRGMPGGRPPSWWGSATQESGGHVVIGNHRFAGRGKGTEGMTTSAAFRSTGTDGTSVGQSSSSTGTGSLFTGVVRPRTRRASGSSSLFPAFSQTVKSTGERMASSLTDSLFDNISKESAPVGVYDNLFGAFDNG